MNNNYYVVIMAGGIGSRFWPKSKANYPKQFIDILGVGKSLLQLTYYRFKEFVNPENIFVVTNKNYSELVAQQLPELEASQIVAEPIRKNTAPCVAYISFKIKKINPDAVVIVAPSDHVILNDDEFQRVALKALNFANREAALLTLGIIPTRPDTGYGYIQYEESSNQDNVFKVKTFTEKPSLLIAKSFLESGDFLWNAGIFIWHIDTILQSFQRHQLEMYEVFVEGNEFFQTLDETHFIKNAYERCINVSIDYAIIEKSDNVYVIPADFGWSDLGTWQSLYDKYEKDYLKNAISGEHVMVFEASNNIVMVPEEKLVVLQGLDNYIVVDTGDVLLICKREMEQEIKAMTQEIKKVKGDKYL